jgi:hypothetical protein
MKGIEINVRASRPGVSGLGSPRNVALKTDSPSCLSTTVDDTTSGVSSKARS